MHSLNPLKDLLKLVSSGALFSSHAPLLACVLRLQGFQRNEWVIGTETCSMCVDACECVGKYVNALKEDNVMENQMWKASRVQELRRVDSVKRDRGEKTKSVPNAARTAVDYFLGGQKIRDL